MSHPSGVIFHVPVDWPIQIPHAKFDQNRTLVARETDNFLKIEKTCSRPQVTWTLFFSEYHYLAVRILHKKFQIVLPIFRPKISIFELFFELLSSDTKDR